MELDRTTDRVRLVWFTTVRWTTVLAGVGAVAAGRAALEVPAPLTPAVLLLALCAASNLWLSWRVRVVPGPRVVLLAPILMCLDVALLTWLLLRAGGVLNPASVFYLVEIVVAALVFGRRWTWSIAGLAVIGYAMLFLAPGDDLIAAQMMHPEIALHMRGMWFAFAVTAIVIAALVTQLIVVVERRDQALADLRERNERVSRAASLATLAAGAAHELSTPLATIAVAARELERAFPAAPASVLGDPASVIRDAQLIRTETDRCRAILDAMAAESGDPAGEPPEAADLRQVLDKAAVRLPRSDRARVDVSGVPSMRVTWPINAMSRSIGNLLNNALQASPPELPVVVSGAAADGDRVVMTIADRGRGMTAEELRRAGEPFFTTKAPGAGTGLGLFVARSTVEQLGGSLTLSSSSGAGTTAALDLPRDVTKARP